MEPGEGEHAVSPRRVRLPRRQMPPARPGATAATPGATSASAPSTSRSASTCAARARERRAGVVGGANPRVEDDRVAALPRAVVELVVLVGGQPLVESSERLPGCLRESTRRAPCRPPAARDSSGPSGRPRRRRPSGARPLGRSPGPSASDRPERSPTRRRPRLRRSRRASRPPGGRRRSAGHECASNRTMTSPSAARMPALSAAGMPIRGHAHDLSPGSPDGLAASSGRSRRRDRRSTRCPRRSPRGSAVSC